MNLVAKGLKAQMPTLFFSLFFMIIPLLLVYSSKDWLLYYIFRRVGSKDAVDRAKKLLIWGVYLDQY